MLINGFNLKIIIYLTLELIIKDYLIEDIKYI
jgi:hypothetical protein